MSNDSLAGQIYDVFSLEEIENIKKVLKFLPDQKISHKKRTSLITVSKKETRSGQ